MKGGDTWELIIKSADGNTDAVKDRLNQIDGASNVLVETTDDGFISAAFFVPSQGANSGERIFDWAVNNGFKILEMNRKKISIEDIFVKLTGAV